MVGSAVDATTDCSLRSTTAQSKVLTSGGKKGKTGNWTITSCTPAWFRPKNGTVTGGLSGVSRNTTTTPKRRPAASAVTSCNNQRYGRSTVPKSRLRSGSSRTRELSLNGIACSTTV